MDLLKYFESRVPLDEYFIKTVRFQRPSSSARGLKALPLDVCLIKPRFCLFRLNLFKNVLRSEIILNLRTYSITKVIFWGKRGSLKDHLGKPLNPVSNYFAFITQFRRGVAWKKTQFHVLFCILFQTFQVNRFLERTYVLIGIYLVRKKVLISYVSAAIRSFRIKMHSVCMCK